MEKFLISNGYEVQGLTVESKDETQWFSLIEADTKLILPTLHDMIAHPELLNSVEAKVYWFMNLRDKLKFKDVTATLISPLELYQKLKYHATSVAVDIETTHADWNNNSLLCIGFCIDGDPCTYIVKNYGETTIGDPFFKLIFQVEEVKYIWHNGLFDIAMLRHLTEGQVNPFLHEDTMLQHYALIDETPGHQKLKDLSVLYLNAGRWDDELKIIRKQYAKQNHIKLADAHFDLIPEDTLFQYNAYDTYCTWWLNYVFTEIGDKECVMLYRTLCEAAPIYAKIGQMGMLVDSEYLSMYGQELQQQHDQAYQIAQEEWQKAWRLNLQETHPNSSLELEAIPLNLNSPAQLKDALRLIYPDIEIQSTAKDALFDLPESSFLNALRDYKKLTKQINTYINGVTSATSLVDGRCRAGFKLTGTATGRLSSGTDESALSKFNYQNIARDKKIKRIFKAKDGYALLQFDMSGCELRVLAALSKDSKMCTIFREGRDLHGEVAESIWGSEYTKANRSCAKTLNFGIAYGMGAAALQRKLHTMGIEVSVAEAEHMIQSWKRQFKVAAQWLDQESFNGMRGIVPQTIFGRKRRFVIKRGEEWKVRNEARNFKVQSVASDVVLHALLRIVHDINDLKYDLINKAYVVNTVHDSIVLETLDNTRVIDRVKDIVLYHMEIKAAQEFEDLVPFKADYEIGYSYAM